MVDEFETWLRSKELELSEKGIRLEIRQSDYTKAVTAFFDAESYFASISVWEIGALDFHAGAVSILEIPIATRFDFQTPDEMLKVAEDIYNGIVSNSYQTLAAKWGETPR